MLPRKIIPSDVRIFIHSGLVYYVPVFTTPVQEFGIKESSFTLLTTLPEKPQVTSIPYIAEWINKNNPDIPHVLKKVQELTVAGSNSLTILRQSLAKLAANEIAKIPEVIPLNCDSVINKTSETTIVFSSNNLFLIKLKPKNLFGAHNHFWSQNILVPFWKGVTFPFEDQTLVKKGDLVEILPNGEKTSTISLNSANEAPSPKRIVFLVEDDQNGFPPVCELSHKQAVQFFTGGFNGKTFDPFFGQELVASIDAKSIVDTFVKLTEANKVSVYLMNTMLNGKNLDLQQLGDTFEAIINGRSTARPAASNTKFETDILQPFLKSTFPAVTF